MVMEYLIKLKVKVEREARRFILFVVFERGVIDHRIIKWSWNT